MLLSMCGKLTIWTLKPSRWLKTDVANFLFNAHVNVTYLHDYSETSRQRSLGPVIWFLIVLYLVYIFRCLTHYIQYHTFGGGSGNVVVFITLLEIQWGQIILSAQILRLGNHCCQNNYLVKDCMCINFYTPILDSQFSIKIVLFTCCCLLSFVA